MASPDPDRRKPWKGRLVRLQPEFYRGAAGVHWTMTMQGRRTGWLSDELHLATREILFHALCRQRLACPIYCLMPDHAHFLWIGISDHSDQESAVEQFRRDWNRILSPFVLERQPFDDVLRGADRERDALSSVRHYIQENPVRKGLVDHFQDWPYLGSCFPGYPKLDPRSYHFRTNFWKAYKEQTYL
ncbi:hypothetical protein [Puniceicoccus vermicola]|uniref:Transposase IS200-like domain-containing protein n=1 Tax=Puniceicoccus vermicola TaxID=388746 RepID=A0A7X1E578_9BACT|nr:hypothetical protein [Puniceicoccus vermicola]MBC2601327.1 hypothetical protein [Puniceicoccus vermicola]